MGVARKVASKLLDEASQDICVGKSSRKDIMSLMGVYSLCHPVVPRVLTV